VIGSAFPTRYRVTAAAVPPSELETTAIRTPTHSPKNGSSRIAKVAKVHPSATFAFTGWSERVPAALGDPRPPPSFPENGSLDVSSLDDRQTLNRPRPRFVPLNASSFAMTRSSPRRFNLGASNVYREGPLSLGR